MTRRIPDDRAGQVVDRPTRRRTTRGYWLVVAALVAVILLVYGLAQWASLPILTDPVAVMRDAGAAAALIGVGLLTADVLLPVPSSWVMIAHGALFGVLAGTALSVLGGAGAALGGFLLGRRGRHVVERVTTPSQRARADRMLTRWGALAVVITRPVPVLAETVAVLAGTSRMRWPVATGAGAVGTAVPAVLYAVAGATGSPAVDVVIVLGLVLLLAGAATVIGRLLARRAGARFRSSTDA